MLCKAARGGLLSKNALCRVPSIAPTANIPGPGRARGDAAGTPAADPSGESVARSAQPRGDRLAAPGVATLGVAAPASKTSSGKVLPSRAGDSSVWTLLCTPSPSQLSARRFSSPSSQERSEAVQTLAGRGEFATKFGAAGEPLFQEKLGCGALASGGSRSAGSGLLPFSDPCSGRSEAQSHGAPSGRAGREAHPALPEDLTRDGFPPPAPRIPGFPGWARRLAFPRPATELKYRKRKVKERVGGKYAK